VEVFLGGFEMTMLYLRNCVKKLKRDLRRLPRGERVVAVRGYRMGFELSVKQNYPNKKDLTSTAFEAPDSFAKHSDFVLDGRYVGNQIPVLEVDASVGFILQETERLRMRFSKPGLGQRVSGFLSEFYQAFGRGFSC